MLRGLSVLGFLLSISITLPILAESGGHWTFDEGQGSHAADRLERAGTAERSRSEAAWSDGVFGSGAGFSHENSSFRVPTSGALNLGEQFSLAAWIQPFRSGTQYVVKKAVYGQTDGYELSLSSRDRRIFFRFNQASSRNDYRLLSETGYPTDGVTWMHVAVSYDGQWIHMYVDGRLEDSIVAPGLVIPENDVDLWIGSGPDGKNPFEGNLDDLRLYDFALSAEQIAGLTTSSDAISAPEIAPLPEEEATAIGTSELPSNAPPGLAESQEAEGQPEADAPLTRDGLLGEWNFDEQGTGMGSDTSGLELHGDLNGVAQSVTGVRGAAFGSADGSGFLEVNAPDQLDVGGAISIAAWVRPNVQATQYVVKKAKWGRVDGFELALSGSLGRAFVRFNQASLGNAQRLVATTEYPHVGEVWQHLAATFDGKWIRLYVDGKLDGELWAPDLVIAQNDLPLTLASGYRGKHGLQGDLDEVRLYDRALAPAEIHSLMAGNTAAAELPSGSATGSDSKDPPVENAEPNPASSIAVGSLGGSGNSNPSTTQEASDSVASPERPSGDSVSTGEDTVVSSPGDSSGTEDLSASPVLDPSLGAASTELLGMWNFDADDSNRIVDASGLEHHGDLQGTREPTPGIRGSGFAAGRGLAHVEIPHREALETEGEITLAAWVRPTAHATQYVIKKSKWGRVDGYELSLSGGSPHPFVRFNQATSGNAYKLVGSSTYPRDGSSWQHLVGTFDGETIRLFVDGQLDASQPAADLKIRKNDLPLSLASEPGGNNGLRGDLDEVRIFNRALELEEIQRLMMGQAIDEVPSVVLEEDPNGTDSLVVEQPMDTDNSVVTDTNDGLPAPDTSNGAPEPVPTPVATPTQPSPELGPDAEEGAADPQPTISTELDPIVEPTPAASGPTEPLPRKKVGHWTFDRPENLVAFDSSGLGHDGSIQGTTFAAVPGRFGQALEFRSGDNRIEIAHANALNVDSGMTLTVWVRPEREATQYLVKKAKYGKVDGYELGLSLSSHRAFIRFNQASSGNDYKVLASSTYPTDGDRWQHLAASFDGNAIRLYVDGQLETTHDAPGLVIGRNDLPISLGAQQDGRGSFEGAMDDVRLYAGALGPDEIRQVMAGRTLGADSDGDGVPDSLDLFPLDAMESRDHDGDGLGDLGDPDDDNDGMPDVWEIEYAFDPMDDRDANLDADGDGMSNLNEFQTSGHPRDGDQDGIRDSEDAFPRDSTEWSDFDEDGVGDNSDPDVDGDGMDDAWELLYELDPRDPSDGNYDPDRDEASNLREFLEGTDPRQGVPLNALGIWRFDEGVESTVYDVSEREHHGRLSTHVPRVSGVTGQALDFTGTTTALVTVPHSADFENAKHWTLAAWIRPVARKTQFIISKLEYGFRDGIELSLSGPTGLPYVRFNQASRGNDFKIFGATRYPTDGLTWIHVAATFDGENITFYTNGVAETVVAAPDLIVGNNTRPLSIGASSSGKNPFDGALDDVRIYARGLSSSEIDRIRRGDLLLSDPEELSGGPGTTQEPAEIVQTVDPTHVTVPSDSLDLSPGELEQETNGSSLETASLESDESRPEQDDSSESPGLPLTDDLSGEREGRHEVGIWQFNEGVGRFIGDASGRGNDGEFKVKGEAPIWTPGVFGNALEFDGSGSRVTVADSDSLDTAHEFTLSTWIRPSKRGTQYVVSKSESDDIDGIEISLSGYQGVPFVRVSRASRGNDFKLYATSHYPTDGTTWMHVAGVFDGRMLRIYINGVLEAERLAEDLVLPVNDCPISIGAGSRGEMGVLGGVDDVRLYRRALDPRELQEVLVGREVHIDTDGDGVVDIEDAFPLDASEFSDLDSDGVGDGTDSDIDGDGIPNVFERDHGLDALDPSDALTDPDLDGIASLREYELGTHPTDRDGDGVGDARDAFPSDPSENSDIDGDGIGDEADRDDDGDGMFDSWEISHGLDPHSSQDASTDSDGDGISNREEFDQGTDPRINPRLFLTGSWGFNEGTGETFADDSNRGNPGVLGTGVNWALGVGGSSLELSPNAEPAWVPTAAGLSLVQRFTTMAWVKPNATGRQTVISHLGSSTGQGYTVGLTDQGHAFVNIVNGDGQPTVEVRTPEPLLADGKRWIHLAARRDDETLTLFVDGIAVESALHSGGTLETGPSSISLGGGGSGEFMFHGSLDAVHLYSEALRDAEIRLVMSVDVVPDWDGDGHEDLADAFPRDPTEWFDADGDGTGDHADPDDDNDGMSDEFERFYGLDPLDARDGSLDSDGDGTTNFEESLFGTDPRDDIVYGNVGTWYMNEGAGNTLIDSSPWSNHGTLGTTAILEEGTLSLLGAGAGAIIEPHRSLDATTELSLAAWVSPTGILDQSLITKGSNGTINGYELGLDRLGRSFIRINGATEGDRNAAYSKSSYPADGLSWMHIAATFDGTEMKLYVNGHLETQISRPGLKVARNELPLQLGGSGENGNGYRGRLDHMAVYDIALTGEEIRELMAIEHLPALDSWKVHPNEISRTSTDTRDKPQSKVWRHRGQWWGVWPDSSGTWVWRLDGDEWTKELEVSAQTLTHADYVIEEATGLVHLVLVAGEDTTLVSIEPISENPPRYELWNQRREPISFPLLDETETATLALDSHGALWVAYDQRDSVVVRTSSQPPYTNWSGEITIAAGIDDDDIGSIVALGNSVAVVWSNQRRGHFGARIHLDGDEPMKWSEKEVPVEGDSTDGPIGLADDHINTATTSDGTLYVVVKTSYEHIDNRPEIVLMARNPQGDWSTLHPVAYSGTRPIVMVNEFTRELIVAYTRNIAGGPIVYRTSGMDEIAFGSERLLMTGNLNNAQSTKQSFTDTLVVIAAKQSSHSKRLVSVKLSP
ncbi:hypothetical protein MK489_09555 [Myxococcota bacterium]|nr:hypothetical protein [Myxococcota bacterium]